MDSPQYNDTGINRTLADKSFKPYYKWIVLNTING